MDQDTDPIRCATCGHLTCKLDPAQTEPPERCPMRSHQKLLAEARRNLEGDPALRRLALTAAQTEAAGYGKLTRIEDTIGLARRLQIDHLGIAFCVGLVREAAAAQAIFEAHGFRVSSVSCKVGAVPKASLGLSPAEQVRPDQFEALCNPTAQARLLDDAGCGLHVLIGLCVGHDSLFFKAARAPVTVLVAKDRVTGHNPVAVLHTSRSYYRRLRDP